MTDKPRVKFTSAGTYLSDGLINVVANLNTGRDKAAHAHYVANNMQPHDLLAAYRSSWLAAAIVDNPADDASRNWRNWRAPAEQITKIEALEKQLGVKGLVNQALIAARLYKAAAIYINTDEADQAAPLKPGKEIRSLVVLTSQVLRPKEVIKDIASPYYGKAEFYTLQTDGAQVDIHASRLVIFLGRQLPANANAVGVDVDGWNADSVLEGAIEAVRQYDSAMANMSSLLYEAKVDVFRFKGFADMLAENNPQTDAMVSRRLVNQAAMKGINGAVVIDMEDDYQQKSATFSGAPELIMKIQESAAGAAGQPVTRLFGRAVAGLSGSGDGDERVYYDRIKQAQENDIGPAMRVLDECLITQALGSRPADVYYEWASLRQSTAAERADVFSKTASAARAIAGNNAGELLPLDAMSDALVNELTELGVLPGLDQRIKEYGSLREQGLPDGEDDFTAPAVIGDAAPRPLYVSRKVTNAAAILKHYASQGLQGLVDAADMHVTITYSRSPVDWMKMGSAWDSKLAIEAGGPRVMEAFGPDKDTAVLSFASSNLKWRHDEMIEFGASWDWPDYQPHVTIAYDFAGDIESIEPWTGEIILGPEIFEELKGGQE